MLQFFKEIIHTHYMVCNKKFIILMSVVSFEYIP